MKTECIKENDTYSVTIYIDDNEVDNIYIKCKKIEASYGELDNIAKLVAFMAERSIEKFCFVCDSNFKTFDNLPIFIEKDKINDDKYIFNEIIEILKIGVKTNIDTYSIIGESLKDVIFLENGRGNLN
jgi:hypothetical protein